MAVFYSSLCAGELLIFVVYLLVDELIFNDYSTVFLFSLNHFDNHLITDYS